MAKKRFKAIAKTDRRNAREAIKPSNVSRAKKTMPKEPVLEPEDDGPDSEGADIPFKKTKAESASDVDEGAEEDKEYVVLKIRAHKFDKKLKTIIYEVEWEGYGDDTTWEPRENLDDCKQLDAYIAENGDPDKAAKATPSKASSSRKRSAADASAGTPSSAPKKRSKNGTPATNGDELKTEISTGGPAQWKAPAGSWEDHIVGVHTIERDPKTGELYAFIEWTGGHKSRHPNKVLHSKCPKKLLEYFEGHLFFYPNNDDNHGGPPETDNEKNRMRAAIAASQQQPVKKVAAGNGDAEVGVGEDEDMADEGGEDVKGVATAT